jgi:uncharacterized protein (DUF488 family)
VRIYTIGFTKSTAESFFTRLQEAGVRRVIDIRLKNTSHLAGFAKAEDLPYFLRAICGIEDYVHRPDLAPTEEIMNAFKKEKGTWEAYERAFLPLLAERRIEETLTRQEVDGACLLCSEDTPEHCHRRLVAEYLRDQWGDVEIIHL